LGWKFALAVVLFDDRQNLLVYKPSHRLPREPLFVAQQGIEVKEIDSEEWGHRISPLTIGDEETQRSTERATLAVRFGRAGPSVNRAFYRMCIPLRQHRTLLEAVIVGKFR
jgi:hypothetical protein